MIFQNPTNSMLFIQLENDLPINNLRIYDIFGKLIIEKTENFNQINVENFSKGVYILEIISDGKIFKNKFFKI